GLLPRIGQFALRHLQAVSDQLEFSRQLRVGLFGLRNSLIDRADTLLHRLVLIALCLQALLGVADVARRAPPDTDSEDGYRRQRKNRERNPSRRSSSLV